MTSAGCRSPVRGLIRFTDLSPCETCPQARQCPLPAARGQSPDSFGLLMRMDAGETLFHSGETFRHLYALRSGIIARWLMDGERYDTVVGFYLPGELAGLGGFADGRYRFTTVAIQPAMVCPMEAEELTASDPPLGMQALRSAMAWQGEVDAHQHRYLKLTDPQRRIAGCLQALRQRAARVALGPGERLRIPLPLIASHLGLDTHVVRELVAHDITDQVTL